LEACPELVTPATPARPRSVGRPDAAFRLVNSVGIALSRFSELNLRGLLPCCVRFAPTSRPVNGNTRYRPACSLWPCGTCARWTPSRGFTVSSSVPPLPSFSQRDDNVGGVKYFLSVLLPALRRARHFALVEGSAIPTKGSLLIVSGQKLSSTHASLRSHFRS
jgi:hypothetical protein